MCPESQEDPNECISLLTLLLGRWKFVRDLPGPNRSSPSLLYTESGVFIYAFPLIFYFPDSDIDDTVQTCCLLYKLSGKGSRPISLLKSQSDFTLRKKHYFDCTIDCVTDRVRRLQCGSVFCLYGFLILISESQFVHVQGRKVEMVYVRRYTYDDVAWPE